MVHSVSPGDGIVTVPSWVGLVGGADAGRRGAYGEATVGGGEFAVSFGETSGFTAPLAGNPAPSIAAEDRRTANLRTAPQEIAGTTVSLSAGVRETRETVIGTMDNPELGTQRSAAGAGSTMNLLDGRLRLDGEIAGAQIDSAAAAAPEADNFAHRLRGELALLRSDDMALTASANLQSAGLGYTMPGVAPDWAQQGVGTRLTSGPFSISLDAEERRNNLTEDATILTVHERTLRPSFAVSLEDLNLRPRTGGRFTAGRLLPSTMRFSHGETQHAERAGQGYHGDLAESDRHIRSESVVLDWNWDSAKTTLSFGTENARARDSAPAGDSTAHAVSLSHAIRGSAIATTLAVSARRSALDGWAGPERSDSYNLAAAFTGRDGPLGDLIAAFAVHHGRTDAPNAGKMLVDTTWEAKLAFDLSRFHPADLRDGALKFAVSVKGGEPVPIDSPFGTELMLGLASQFGF